MSTTIEYYQGLSDESVRWWASHGSTAQERAFANQVIQAREDERRRRSRQETEASQTLQNNISNLNRQITNLEHTNSSLQRLVNDNNQRIATMQRESNIAINRVIEETNAAIDSEREARVRDNLNAINAINTVRSETRDEINAARTLLNNRITALRNETNLQLQTQQQQITSLHNSVSSMLRSDAERLRNASEYLEHALPVINSTIEYNNSNYHSWRSGDLIELSRLRENAAADIANNDGVAARMSARDLFQAALAYQANVYSDEQAWQMHSAEAHRALTEARARLDASRKSPLDNGFEIDVDSWSCGDLSRIEAQLNNMQTLIDNPCCSIEELDAAADLCGTYIGQIDSTLAFALPAAQSSSDREEILDAAVESITQRFGTLRPLEGQPEFLNNDPRLGCGVILNSNDGDRVVLTATPVMGSDGRIRNSFQFDVDRYGTSISNLNEAEHFLNNIYEAVRTIPGIMVTRPACTNQSRPANNQNDVDRNTWANPSNDAVEGAIRNITPRTNIPNVPHVSRQRDFERQSTL